MTELTFPELAEQIQKHFAEQTYAEGLSLASKHLTAFPEEYTTINYWRICLAARLDQPDLCNTILESTLASGIWLSDFLLRQSPSLEKMQGNTEFERLAGISAQMREVDGAEVPLLVARPQDACNPGEAGCPAVIFLHGNMDSAQKNLEAWAHLPAEGWLVAVPQSSNALWAGAYMWTDHETARQELTENYQRITNQYSLDEQRLVWGGFSMGGEIALALALSGDLPASGFFLLGPGGRMMDQIEDWQPLIAQAAGRGLRGAILMGEADETIPRENIRRLAELLNQGGIPTQLQTFPGLGHAYPPDFEQAAAEALAFILS
jgi:predicted esterase